MRLHVLDVLVLAGEQLVAVGAVEADVGHVTPLVRRQVALYGELFITYCAGEGSQARMDTFVRVQARLLRETLLADITFEGFLASVRALVYF